MGTLLRIPLPESVAVSKSKSDPKVRFFPFTRWGLTTLAETGGALSATAVDVIATPAPAVNRFRVIKALKKKLSDEKEVEYVFHLIQPLRFITPGPELFDVGCFECFQSLNHSCESALRPQC